MTKLASYITGFVLSVALTIVPLALLWMHEAGGHAFPSHEALYALFTIFAVAQMLVQLYFFLHVGHETGPRWNLAALCFALLVVAILVGGTLWIMQNLSHMQEQSQLPVLPSRVPFIEGAITPAGSND
jgi:cytochrome o ubiquinol oxidase operon protein cyoD